MSISTELTRLAQLEALYELSPPGGPLLIHGSIGHAAMMGLQLPPENTFTGEPRDIDVFAPYSNISDLKSMISAHNLDTPNPVDAGLCGLLVHEPNGTFAVKDDVAVELRKPDVLKETTVHEVGNGVRIRSFSIAGSLAVHSLEPTRLRLGHSLSDAKLVLWFSQNSIKIPCELKESIREFHRAYNEKYPHRNFYTQLADAYVKIFPEKIRSRFRTHTHRFMKDRTGRESPFVDNS